MLLVNVICHNALPKDIAHSFDHGARTLKALKLSNNRKHPPNHCIHLNPAMPKPSHPKPVTCMAEGLTADLAMVDHVGTAIVALSLSLSLFAGSRQAMQKSHCGSLGGHPQPKMEGRSLVIRQVGSQNQKGFLPFGVT